jgi:hypothetical protein
MYFQTTSKAIKQWLLDSRISLIYERYDNPFNDFFLRLYQTQINNNVHFVIRQHLFTRD